MVSASASATMPVLTGVSPGAGRTAFLITMLFITVKAEQTVGKKLNINSSARAAARICFFMDF